VLGLEKFWAILIIAALTAAAVRYAPIVPRRYRIAASVVVILAFLCYMPFTVDTFRTSQLTTIVTWSIVALGLNMLTGYNGQISLGHGAFVLIGAYTAAILTDAGQQLGFVDASAWPFWTAMIAAGVVAAIAGAAVGIPSLRLSGPYLAVATLALVIALPPVFEKYDGLTGGRTGLRVPQPHIPGLLDGVLERQQWFFFLAVVTALLLFALAWYIVRSRWGRAFVAVRDSEVAATSVGISVARYKVLAFTLSAFYAGVAGSLFVFAIAGYISPQSIAILLSINFFTAIVIGGLGSIMGSMIGGFVVVLLPEVSTELGSVFVGDDRAKRLWPTFYGSILIVVIILMPYGVAGFLHRLGRLTLSDAGAALRGIPDGLSRRARTAKEDLSWTWETRPFKRESRNKD
jgi:branched-chain amino acid transport system permease protein